MATQNEQQDIVITKGRVMDTETNFDGIRNVGIKAMKQLTWSVILALTVFSVAYAAPISQDAKRELRQPVNCATAEGDIRVLESEKAHAGKQLLSGIMAISPAGAVIGILTGTEGDKLKVATGDYNRQIEAKIAEIKRTCDL
jgi:hypothetical protein